MWTLLMMMALLDRNQAAPLQEGQVPVEDQLVPQFDEDYPETSTRAQPPLQCCNPTPGVPQHSSSSSSSSSSEAAAASSRSSQSSEELQHLLEPQSLEDMSPSDTNRTSLWLRELVSLEERGRQRLQDMDSQEQVLFQYDGLVVDGSPQVWDDSMETADQLTFHLRGYHGSEEGVELGL